MRVQGGRVVGMNQVVIELIQEFLQKLWWSLWRIQRGFLLVTEDFQAVIRWFKESLKEFWG